MRSTLKYTNELFGIMSVRRVTSFILLINTAFLALGFLPACSFVHCLSSELSSFKCHLLLSAKFTKYYIIAPQLFFSSIAR